MTEVTNRTESMTYKQHSNKNLSNKTKEEIIIKDLFMTIQINSTVLSEMLTNSPIGIDSTSIGDTLGILKSIIVMMKDNIKKYLAIEHIDHYINYYKDYLNMKIENEKNKEKALRKEINTLKEKEDKPNGEVNHIRKSSVPKSDKEKKDDYEENITLVIDPNKKAVEMNSELRALEEIINKVHNINIKKEEEVIELENTYELLQTKLNALLHKDNENTNNNKDGNILNGNSKKFEDKYEKYFEAFENESQVISIDSKDIIQQEDKENYSPKVVESRIKTEFNKTTRNEIRRIQKRKSTFFNNIFKVKKDSSNINSLERNTQLNENTPPVNGSIKKFTQKTSDLTTEYEKEKKLNQEYILEIKKYKALYNKYKQKMSEY